MAGEDFPHPRMLCLRAILNQYIYPVIAGEKKFIPWSGLSTLLPVTAEEVITAGSALRFFKHEYSIPQISIIAKKLIKTT